MSDDRQLTPEEKIDAFATARNLAEQAAIRALDADVLRFFGPCNFLTCLETGEHVHGACPDCGAVRFGNLGCQTCRQVYNEFRSLIGLPDRDARKEGYHERGLTPPAPLY